jgi:hypothetical protein
MDWTMRYLRNAAGQAKREQLLREFNASVAVDAC